VKTTGGKGLHVVLPLEAKRGWDEVKDFSRRIAELLERADPKLFIANMAKSRRKGKIFVDYLRNGETASAVAAWSVRARAGATVSMPLEWRELGDTDLRERFNLRTAARRADPWKGYWTTRQSITTKMLKSL
jgi:bifunctional non-homologous end joining protein LigD